MERLKHDNVCLEYTARYRCGARSEDGSQKDVYQSAEVSGILMPWYVDIVEERQIESTYIDIEGKYSWVAFILFHGNPFTFLSGKHFGSWLFDSTLHVIHSNSNVAGFRNRIGA